MKKIIVFLGLFTGLSHAFAQVRELDRIADSIKTEGKLLFKSEWASWYGTDIFLDKCKDKRALIGGYISYDTGKGMDNVFFSKDDEPIVLGTTSFGYDFNPGIYKLDTGKRKLTRYEKELYTIRQTAIKRINSDTTFKQFKNSNLNPIPIIDKGVKKVYVLTGPELNNVVILGNDYLLTFNDDNSIKTVKRLHKNIIPINYGKVAGDTTKTTGITVHSHLPETGDFITATDICTLMLYQHLTQWNQHYVISKNDISIWDCKKNDLTIITMEVWKKINADQAARHPAKTN